MTQKKIDHFFDISIALLLFSLPFSLAAPNLILGIVFILFLYKKKQRILSNTYLWLLFIFVFYFLVKSFLFKNLIDNLFVYKHLFTISLISLFVFHVKKVLLVIKAFILGILLAVFISIFKIIIFYLEYKQFPFGNNSNIDNLLLIDRPYFGFSCFLAIVLLHYLYKESEKIYVKKTVMVVIVILTFFLFVIVARLALILSIFFLIFQILIHLNLSKGKLLAVFCFLVIIASGLLTLNENVRKRFHIKSSISDTLAILKNQEPRFVIWQCSIIQYKDATFTSLTGYNNRAEVQLKLNDCYNNTITNNSKRAYYLKKKFNTHNQFLDIFLTGGFVGFILFLSIFLYVFHSFRMHFNATFVLFGFVAFLFLENLFFRQLGTYLFGIFIPLFCVIIERCNKDEIQ